MKYCWGGYRDGPATEMSTREEREEMRGGERERDRECKKVKDKQNKQILYNVGGLCGI